MGCQVGKVLQASSDPLDSSSLVSLRVLQDKHKLEQLFSQFNGKSSHDHQPNLEEEEEKRDKVIFVLGGVGSQKGEFIWRLIKDSLINYIYIDVETLIVSNIKSRVQSLIQEGVSFAGYSAGVDDFDCEEDEESQSFNYFSTTTTIDETTLDSSSPQIINDSNSKNERRKHKRQQLKIRQYLNDFCNVITFNWILDLITSEMKIETESIFLINLLPNRVNLFKRCLFLNQTPNLYHVSFDFLAVNIINDYYSTILSGRKDLLDLIQSNNNTNIYDEANNMFVRYFRSINKLINVSSSSTDECQEENQVMIVIRVTFNDTSSDAIKVNDWKQVKRLLMSCYRRNSNTVIKNSNQKLVSHRTKHFTINPVNLIETSIESKTTSMSPRSSIHSTNNHNDEHEKTRKSCTENSIFFIVDNKIELDREKITLELDSSVFQFMSKVKLFVTVVKKAWASIQEEQQEQQEEVNSRRGSNNILKSPSNLSAISSSSSFNHHHHQHHQHHQ